MTSTKIDWSFNRIARLSDLSDLAEMLFPGNRNQQHAFLVLWNSLKWADHHLVPNFGEVTVDHRISRRTLERVRAKMRRLGLIDHISRFNSTHGYREGWILSTRFERSLVSLAQRVRSMRDTSASDRAKDAILISLADARSDAARRSGPTKILFKRGEEIFNQHDN